MGTKTDRQELRKMRYKLAQIYSGSDEWISRVHNMSAEEVYNTTVRQSIAETEVLKYVEEAALAPLPPTPETHT